MHCENYHQCCDPNKDWVRETGRIALNDIRNATLVLIYTDQPTKENITSKYAASCKPPPPKTYKNWAKKKRDIPNENNRHNASHCYLTIDCRELWRNTIRKMLK